MQPLQQQFCHTDLYFCIGSISKRGNGQNPIQEDQNSQMGGLWVAEGGKEDPKLVPEGWVGVRLLEGKWGMSWLVSIIPRANQVFFFFFLNKGTAIPFLVPTYPERKAILVMWVVSISPPLLLTLLCRSAGPSSGWDVRLGLSGQRFWRRNSAGEVGWCG